MSANTKKIANLLEDRESNQRSKFRRKNWVEVSDASRGEYTNRSDVKFKTKMVRSSLRDYGEAYVLVNGTVAIPRAGNDSAAIRADKRNKCVIFNYGAPYDA